MLLSSLLRQDAAQPGPREARRMRAGKARRGARTMRALRRMYRDVHPTNPRSAFAHPQGRMPGGRAARGVLSLATFFAQAKKVARSAQPSGSSALEDKEDQNGFPLSRQ